MYFFRWMGSWDGVVVEMCFVEEGSWRRSRGLSQRCPQAEDKYDIIGSLSKNGGVTGHNQNAALDFCSLCSMLIRRRLYLQEQNILHADVCQSLSVELKLSSFTKVMVCPDNIMR